MYQTDKVVSLQRFRPLWRVGELSKIEMTFVQTANQLGVAAVFAEYDVENKDTNPDAGVYLIMAPTKDDLSCLVNDRETLEKAIMDDKHSSSDLIHMKACTVKVTREDLSDKNFFSYYQNIIRQVQYYATALNAYREIGCGNSENLPAYCWKSYIDDFRNLDMKRNNMDATYTTRENYDRIFKNQVKRVASISENQEHSDYDYFEKRSLFSSKNKDGVHVKTHRVPNLEYFVEHNMDIITMQISSYLLDFVEKKIRESKNFVYWRSEKPTMELEDISEINKKEGKKNIWAADKKYTEYSIAFPRNYASQYYKWNLEFNMREYELTSIPDLLESSKFSQLFPIQINYKDLWNWNSLCQANNVKIGIDFNKFLGDRVFTPEDVSKPTFYYRREDYQMVQAIVGRLMTERATYIEPGLKGKSIGPTMTMNTVEKEKERIKMEQRKYAPIVPEAVLKASERFKNPVSCYPPISQQNNPTVPKRERDEVVR